MHAEIEASSFGSSASSLATGAPEGDSMSVCAMLAIAATFFKRMSNIRITPFTYADNWTFMSQDKRSFPECVAKGSRLTLGGLGVEPCSRSVVSTPATVRNRSR